MLRAFFSSRLFVLAAFVLALGATWALARPLPEVEQQRRHFVQLQQQVNLARASKEARVAARGRVLRLQAQARASQGAQRDAFVAEAAALETSLAWGDDARVREAVLTGPLVSVTRASRVPGFPDASAERGTGCQSCHVAIAAPGYEAYPAPFRTHSQLTSYVGAGSPHPPSRVGCASCHQGDEYADSFAGAGHSTMRASASADEASARVVPVVQRSWAPVDRAGAMLPVGRTDAGCVSCHQGELYQPGAARLNEALVSLQRGGCYACHDTPGMERTAKRGPDLRRVASKLRASWVRTWLADPSAVKPSTWMPRFWNTPTSEDAAVEIDAVVAYLTASSEAWAPSVSTPPVGDVARGKALAESVGCLGCHVVGDASRDTTSVRRTFGQPLDGIGDKVTAAWLFDWVRDPKHFSPTTRMPNLRLDASQAADLAAWLGSLRRREGREGQAGREGREGLDGQDARFRAVVARYAGMQSDQPHQPNPPSAVEPVAVSAGRAVIEALGCFNCHEIAGFENRRAVVAVPARAVWRDADLAQVHAEPRGLAAAGKAPAYPAFRFGSNESSRLALALTAVAGPVRAPHALSTPWQQSKVAGRALVQERNCVGCHQIEGTGGDMVSLVAEPTLGPPLLTPEGSRVQQAWLKGFLRAPSTVRPWLSVRMPTFGLADHEVDAVDGYFTAIAVPNPKPEPAPSGATAAAGRDLFTLLKCQQCHVLGQVPKDQPTSNLAPDLRLAHERLQPDWILTWLRNPGAILPGTRMPSFWPDYPKSFYEPLGKDGAAQVRAVREHLLTLR